MTSDDEKQLAATASLAYVRDGDVVGLGTGSTATFMIHALAQRVRDGLRVRGVPTSARTQELATTLGIPIVTFDDVQDIDVTIDGADEFDPQLALTKGGGGALLREKIVASASRKLVIVTDSSKRVATLGRFPLPVEVIGFAGPLVAKRIAALGGTPQLRRDGSGKPYVTDEGHHILDCRFGAISDVRRLARALDDMPGVVEHGLFIDMASVVLVAEHGQVTELQRSTAGS
jgi:ribose 5-phosphate isomerase A